MIARTSNLSPILYPLALAFTLTFTLSPSSLPSPSALLALEPCIDWPRALSLETLLEAELPDAIASAGLGRSTSDAPSP